MAGKPVSRIHRTIFASSEPSASYRKQSIDEIPKTLKMSALSPVGGFW
jgi:hypothetical protein